MEQERGWMKAERAMPFAILGCGAIAATHAKAMAALPGHARLVACCDTIPERAAKLAAEFGCRAADWKSILAGPEVEAVSICTPSGMHAAQAAEAMRAGKHALVEKPMDITVEACDAALAAERETGRRLGVISQHRFDPASIAVRRLLDEGALGRLFGVEARVPWFRTQGYYDSGDWRGTWAMDGGGCLMNQGVHTLDLMLWMAGPARRVWARAATAAHERIEVEDHLCATVEFASGAIGNLLASTSCYPGYPARLEMHGTQGSAILEGDALQTLAIQGREVAYGAAHADAVHVATGGTREANTRSAEESLGNAWVWGDAHR